MGMIWSTAINSRSHPVALGNFFYVERSTECMVVREEQILKVATPEREEATTSDWFEPFTAVMREVAYTATFVYSDSTYTSGVMQLL